MERLKPKNPTTISVTFKSAGQEITLELAEEQLSEQELSPEIIHDISISPKLPLKDLYQKLSAILECQPEDIESLIYNNAPWD